MREKEEDMVTLSREDFNRSFKGEPADAYEEGFRAAADEVTDKMAQTMRMMANDFRTSGTAEKIFGAGILEALADSLDDDSLLKAAGLFEDDDEEDAPDDVKDLLPGKDLN